MSTPEPINVERNLIALSSYEQVVAMIDPLIESGYEVLVNKEEGYYRVEWSLPSTGFEFILTKSK